VAAFEALKYFFALIAGRPLSQYMQVMYEGRGQKYREYSVYGHQAHCILGHISHGQTSTPCKYRELTLNPLEGSTLVFLVYQAYKKSGYSGCCPASLVACQASL
jgi:hypothetical protein